MPTPANRVRIQSIDWAQVLPFIRLAGAFRLAIQPGKFILALLAVLVLHFAGLGLETTWPSEGPSASTAPGSPGVYSAFIDREIASFRSIVGATGALEFGLYSSQTRQVGALGGLLNLLIHNPLGLIFAHPGFAAVYGLIALAIFSLIGGTICRMAATQACGERSISAGEAGRFVLQRAAWFLLTPIMPLALIGVLALVLILAGLVFFNVGVLDVVGALLYGPMLLIGLVIALIALVVFFAIHLMTPALAVEGTDGFDAVSRAMNYVMFRPWQLGFYLVAAAVYASVIYLLVGGLAELTVGVTATVVEVGVFAESDQGDEVSRFEAAHREAAVSLHASQDPGSTPGWIIGRWLEGIGLIVTAFMFSLYCCLQTLVYLLIRRTADGTPLDEYDPGDPEERWSTPEDVLASPDPDAPASEHGDD
ncbi:MAG: hypothetical protein AAGC44_12380 [Planctomycetota bacterium]